MNLEVNVNRFLDKFFEEISRLKIDVHNLQLDHIAYCASSKQNYDEMVNIFKEHGDLVHEAIIGGRRVGAFALAVPINYKGYTIIAIELVEPTVGQVIESGFEHAEFVLKEDYNAFMFGYPQIKWDISSMDRPVWSHLKIRLTPTMQVKFHKMDILETAKLDKKHD